MSRTWLILVVLLAVACSTSNDASESGAASSSILAGRNEPLHPETMLLIRYAQGEQIDSACTVTLISKRAILTAAHCVGVFAKTPTGSCVSVDGNPPDALESIVSPDRISIFTEEIGYTSNYQLVAKDSHKVSRILVPPAALGDRLCGSDIAILELETPIDSVTPAPVRLTKPVAVGNTVTIVGYGRDGAKGTGGRRRIRSDISISSFGGSKSESGVDESYSTEWGIDSGACSGDSGSPAFDSGGAVVGVMSRDSGTPCERLVYARVDATGGFGDWIRRSVQEIASRNHEPQPDWAQPANAAADASGAGCNASETSRNAAGLKWAAGLAFVVGLLAIRRRRSPAHESASA